MKTDYELLALLFEEGQATIAMHAEMKRWEQGHRHPGQRAIIDRPLVLSKELRAAVQERLEAETP